ncbi:MAG: response regulator [Oscillospiraceae bacterium]|jgi:signal transduction histidine kinase/CheY-like chemotaxis protein|nr:response regulator [Oscillospiraceae bacterium]
MGEVINGAELNERLAELEKVLKRKDREIARLRKEFEQEKIYENARSNQAAARTLAQRMRDQYLQLLLSNSPSIILFLDKSKRVVFCTDSLQKQFDTQGFDNVSGLLISEIFEPFCDAAFLALLLENLDIVMGGEPSLTFTGEARLSGAELRKYEVSYTSMLTQDGKSEGTMLLFHDVTEIEDARTQAEHASLVKSQFLSNMSHEIRTPMNAIIGMTKLAKDSSDTDRKDYCLDKIEDASNHLLGVINDILDMSKIEAGKLELSSISFNFEKMLRRVVNVVNYKLNEREQKFTVNLDPAIPPVIVSDDQRLAQVITNLLGNAVKFTPERGAVTLDTRLLREVDGVCTIQIRVTDTGIGISAEQQARLFKSFQQAESDTTRKFGGTGLGLAISKNIVDMMGGSIWIESELGKGSTFAFNIQVKRGHESQPTRLSPATNWENIRFLVVDDDEDTLNYFEQLTLRLGLVCDTAAGGEQALKLISENGAYNMYFIDWHMPEMDGVELTRRIRQGGSAESAVILVSGSEWGAIESEAKAAGVNEYLPKPLFPSMITDMINDYLGLDSIISSDPTIKRTADNFSGRHVLLAEDVEVNREIVMALLEPTQISIDCAVNGAEAVKMFVGAPDKYDVIFMDVQMPEMDGYEATRAIRALEIPRAQTIPIVAMTANVFREDIDNCLAAGMNDHVGKPIDINEVLEKLRQYMAAYRRQ